MLFALICFAILILICAPVYHDFFTNTLQGRKSDFPDTFIHLWMRLVLLIMPSIVSDPPPYEKLVGDMRGMYSRRINRQHSLFYDVDEEQKIVRIISMWTHYEQ